jgi:hypothetical protein
MLQVPFPFDWIAEKNYLFSSGTVGYWVLSLLALYMQDCNIGEQNVTGPVKWWYGFKKKKKMIHGFELSSRAWFDLVNSSQHWALFDSFWAQSDHG